MAGLGRCFAYEQTRRAPNSARSGARFSSGACWRCRNLTTRQRRGRRQFWPLVARGRPRLIFIPLTGASMARAEKPAEIAKGTGCFHVTRQLGGHRQSRSSPRSSSEFPTEKTQNVLTVTSRRRHGAQARSRSRFTAQGGRARHGPGGRRTDGAQRCRTDVGRTGQRARILADITVSGPSRFAVDPADAVSGAHGRGGERAGALNVSRPPAV